MMTMIMDYDVLVNGEQDDTIHRTDKFDSSRTDAESIYYSASRRLLGCVNLQLDTESPNPVYLLAEYCFTVFIGYCA